MEGSLLNFAFAFEPAEDGVMKRDPYVHNSRNILSGLMKKLTIIVGMITGIFTLVLFLFLKQFTDMGMEEIRTIMFLTLALDTILFTFSFKNFKKPIWKIKLFSNKFLIVSLTISVLVLVAAMVVEPLKTVLQLTTLNAVDFFIILCVAAFNLFTIEIAKYFIFERKLAK